LADVKLFLVPGFFGFVQIEGVDYFRGVASLLQDKLGARGIEVDVFECRTSPTGSVRRRAGRLLDQVRAAGGLEAREIHFVSHSMGGLDVRLALTPGVHIRKDDLQERVGERVRSAISVATPHHGTPIANFFTTAQGRHLIDLVRTIVAYPTGRYALTLAAKTARLALTGAITTSPAAIEGEPLFRSFAGRALSWFAGRSKDPTWGFLTDVSSDLGAVIQLTPEAMDIFNAAVTDRPSVAYSSILTGVRMPLATLSLAELTSADRVALRGVFILLYTLAALEHAHYPYPRLGRDLKARLSRLVPYSPSPATNDGIVPTLSQVYGEVLDIFEADHLDVIGRYVLDPSRSVDDWMMSGSGFSEPEFQRLLDRVADEIEANHLRA
jgi:triacylglycerol lipase